MKLERFKEKDNKRKGIVVFTIICILLVSGVILYRTFAIFEVKTHQNVIKGTVQDPGNLYFAFYVDDKIEKMMPQKNEGYIFDEENSYCGVLGNRDDSISLDFDKDKWNVTVSGLKESRTKCNLHFVKGAYILGKPVKATTSGDGLYETTHEGISGTLNDDGFKQTEFRYAGTSPNNYITFNGELWRIIGLVNVMISEDKVEQRVKIIRDKTLEEYQSWNSNNSNDWTNSTLMTYLNNAYYTTLNENEKRMIDQEIIWNIGGWSTPDIKADEVYFYEKSTNTYNSHPYEWKKELNQDSFHSIGLMAPSDYGYATVGTSEKTRENCTKETILNNYDSNSRCYETDWLLPKKGFEWLLFSTTTYDGDAFLVYFEGRLVVGSVKDPNFVKPALYLKSNIQIVNNNKDGSKESPYDLIQTN